MTSHDDLRADFNRAAELVRQLTVVLDRLEHRLDTDDDPTGLGYSREDDEAEPAAPVREHYGFTVTGRNQRPTNHPRPSAGEADARLDAAAVAAAAREALTGAPTPVRAGASSPAGFASTERRTHQVNGRPGSKLSAARLGGSAADMGRVALGGATLPTLRGGGLR